MPVRTRSCERRAADVPTRCEAAPGRSRWSTRAAATPRREGGERPGRRPPCGACRHSRGFAPRHDLMMPLPPELSQNGTVCPRRSAHLPSSASTRVRSPSPSSRRIDDDDTSSSSAASIPTISHAIPRSRDRARSIAASPAALNLLTSTEDDSAAWGERPAADTDTSESARWAARKRRKRKRGAGRGAPEAVVLPGDDPPDPDRVHQVNELLRAAGGDSVGDARAGAARWRGYKPQRRG